MRVRDAPSEKRSGIDLNCRELDAPDVRDMLAQVDSAVKKVETGDVVTKKEALFFLRNRIAACNLSSEFLGETVMQSLLKIEYESLDVNLNPIFLSLLRTVVGKFGLTGLHIDDRFFQFLEQAAHVPDCQANVLALLEASRGSEQALVLLATNDWNLAVKGPLLSLWQKVLLCDVRDEYVQCALHLCWPLVDSLLDPSLRLLVAIANHHFRAIPSLIEYCNGLGQVLTDVFRRKVPNAEACLVLQFIGFVYGRRYQIPDLDVGILMESLADGNENLFADGCFAVTNFVLSTGDSGECMNVLRRMNQLLQGDIAYKPLLEVSLAMLDILEHSNLEGLPMLFDEGLIFSFSRILDVCVGYKPAIVDQFFRVMNCIYRVGNVHGWHQKFLCAFQSVITISELDQMYDFESLREFRAKGGF